VYECPAVTLRTAAHLRFGICIACIRVAIADCLSQAAARSHTTMLQFSVWSRSPYGQTLLGLLAFKPFALHFCERQTACSNNARWMCGHTVLLTSSGSAVACGYNVQGQCKIHVLKPGTSYSQDLEGHDHTVLLRICGAAVACDGGEQCGFPVLLK